MPKPKTTPKTLPAKPKKKRGRPSKAEQQYKKMSKEWALAKDLLNCPTFRTMYFWGPPGIGKTYGAQRYGMDKRKGTNANVYCVTLTEETPAAELRGHFVPKGGEFLWHDGPVTRAMREGARLIINEVAHASADVTSFLYAVLESPETAKITLPTGETVRPAQGFQAVLTDNTSPDSLPRALQDRIDVSIHVVAPAPEALESYPPTMREVVLKCATVEDESRRISLRAWETIARLGEGGIPIDRAGPAVLQDRWPSLSTALKVALASESNPELKEEGLLSGLVK